MSPPEFAEEVEKLAHLPRPFLRIGEAIAVIEHHFTQRAQQMPAGHDVVADDGDAAGFQPFPADRKDLVLHLAGGTQEKTPWQMM